MRPTEEGGTRLLLSTLVWHPVETEVAEEAGVLGRSGSPVITVSTALTSLSRLRPPALARGY